MALVGRVTGASRRTEAVARLLAENKREVEATTGKSDDTTDMCFDFMAMGKCPRGEDCPYKHTTREQYVHNVRRR